MSADEHDHDLAGIVKGRGADYPNRVVDAATATEVAARGIITRSLGLPAAATDEAIEQALHAIPPSPIPTTIEDRLRDALRMQEETAAIYQRQVLALRVELLQAQRDGAAVAQSLTTQRDRAVARLARVHAILAEVHADWPHDG